MYAKPRIYGFVAELPSVTMFRRFWLTWRKALCPK